MDGSVKSLIATISIPGLFNKALKVNLPILPNPFIAILVMSSEYFVRCRQNYFGHNLLPTKDRD
jgi:hypothetical protein